METTLFWGPSPGERNLNRKLSVADVKKLLQKKIIIKKIKINP